MLEELHLMVDLETLATSNRAVVASAGWALFETQGSVVNMSGGWAIELKYQLKGQHQREVSEPTLCDFWMKQSDAARELTFCSGNKISVSDFLIAFENEIPWHNITGIWSHGLDFDLPILGDLFGMYDMPVPWGRRTPRDTRTLFWLAGIGKEDLIKPEIAHSAEHDAIAQALTVQLALKKLGPQGKEAW